MSFVSKGVATECHPYNLCTPTLLLVPESVVIYAASVSPVCNKVVVTGLSS